MTRELFFTGSPRTRWVGALFLSAVLGLVASCGEDHGEHLRFTGEATPPPVGDLVFEEPPPLFSEEDLFPCMEECHGDPDQVTNPERRKLTMMHDDIVLRHDEEHRWCLDCHDAENRDRLRLANGTLVPFEESYRLCGQCHGDKYRDWRLGVHGRRVGHWNGDKLYRLCVHCHNAHAPKFKPLEPMPVPVKPENLR